MQTLVKNCGKSRDFGDRASLIPSPNRVAKKLFHIQVVSRETRKLSNLNNKGNFHSVAKTIMKADHINLCSSHFVFCSCKNAVIERNVYKHSSHRQGPDQIRKTDCQH